MPPTGPAAGDEEGEVDIGGGSTTGQLAPLSPAANPWAGQPLLHLPLQLEPIDQAAGAAAATKLAARQQRQEGEEQRIDVG